MRGGRTIINSKPKPFISTWKTDNLATNSSTATQIRLPLSVSGSYNFMVYWGDNTSSSISSALQPDITHSYASTGTYFVTMSGYIKGFSFNNTPDRRKIINISQWGGIKLSSNGSQFYGCDALTLNNILDTPNLYSKNINPTFSSSIASIFRSCSLLTSISRLDQWDTSQVQFMGITFYSMPLFNQNIGSWNTGRVTNMDNMFSMPSNATGSFDNGGSNSINNWNTGEVITMASMFYNQPSFNRNIENWDVGKVANFSFMLGIQSLNGKFDNSGSDSFNNWNVSSSTNMSSMFLNQPSFNRNIGNWNVGKVTNFSSMFAISTAATGSFNNGSSDSIKNWNMSSSTSIRAMFQRQPLFNREIGLWNIGNVTDMAFLLAGGVDKAFNNAGSASIGTWNTSKVTNITSMFVGCNLFDQNVGAWNTSNVLTMDGLFYCSGTPGIFNNSGSSTINNWDTSKVTNMSGLFRNQALPLV